MPSHLDTYRLAVELLEVTESKLARVERMVAVEDLWKSMSFCILSSNVHLHVANRALAAVSASPCLFNGGVNTDELAAEIKIRLLNVGYRFHTSKARQLALSWAALVRESDYLSKMLAIESDTRKIREYMVEKFPGLGLKQASMFLRDIGATSELAIIDIHIRRFLAAHVSDFNPSNKRDYLRAEAWLAELAETHDCSIAAFDLAIWAAMRTFSSMKPC